MTTTPKDDFAGASPRPWREQDGLIVDANGAIVKADWPSLIVKHANAYNRERDAKLREAIRETLQQLREYKEMLPPEIHNKLEAKAFAALALLPEEH